MQIPRRLGRERPRSEGFSFAPEDASRISSRASEVIDGVVDVGWYEEVGNDVDRVAYLLCRLRRARAGGETGPAQGDEAVRQVLQLADPEALVWFASRTVSYMDETGFPEAVEHLFPDDVPQD